MTDKTALRQLIEAVEVGKIYLPESEKWESLTMSGFLPNKAFYGSLDAAKALHEALLPNMRWSVGSRVACVWVEHSEADGFYQASQSNPARAWLIAVLKAYEAQQ